MYKAILLTRSSAVAVIADHTAYNVHRVSKKQSKLFSSELRQISINLVIIFGTKMAKKIELCVVHLFSTSPNLCRRTTM